MSVEASTPARPALSVRLDPAESRDDDPDGPRSWAWPRRFAALAVLAAGFVLIGGGNLDPGPAEARVGLAAFEKLGPFGRVFGGWDPSVLPGRLLPAWVWAWGEGGTPTSASVRWPEAIAGVVLGLVLARRASQGLGGRAGLLVGLCWYGSVGLIDRSSTTGLDLVTALGTVAALDRVLGKGSDLVAGLFAAFAFLAGGWPPVAVVALAALVIGRQGASLSWKLLTPPALAAAGWSAWALASAPAEVWAASVALPLTQKPAVWLAPGVVALGLPWSPLAALFASRTVRDGWPEPGRALVVDWLKVAAACLLAGTVVPGLADAARAPALAGLAVAAAAVCERFLRGTAGVAAGARFGFFGWGVALALAWAVVCVLGGGYLAAAVAYYRAVSVVLIVLGLGTAGLAVASASKREARGLLLALFALAAMAKVAHWGYYAPEWNYRYSQGPWGRAVGQWLPARWPLYATHPWNADLAFATGHPVHQLLSPQHVGYLPGGSHYLLLAGPEYENWPEQAPPLKVVARFEDEHGGTRVLVRTEGELPWDHIAPPEATDDLE